MTERRDDLGIEIRMFIHRDRNGGVRTNFTARDVFGAEIPDNELLTPRIQQAVHFLMYDLFISKYGAHTGSINDEVQIS